MVGAGIQRREKKGEPSAFDRRFRDTLSKVERLSQPADLRRQKRKMRAGYGIGGNGGGRRRGVGVRGAGRVSALQRGKRAKGGETRLITAHGSREDGAWTGLVQSFSRNGREG